MGQVPEVPECSDDSPCFLKSAVATSFQLVDESTATDPLEEG